jgi:hypothetical protein
LPKYNRLAFRGIELAPPNHESLSNQRFGWFQKVKRRIGVMGTMLSISGSSYICFTLLFLCIKDLILARKLLGGGGAHSMSLTGLSSTTITFTTQILPTNIIFRCNCYIALEKLALFNDMKCSASSIFFHYLLKCYAIWLNSDEKHSILWWKDCPLLFLLSGRCPRIPTALNFLI